MTTPSAHRPSSAMVVAMIALFVAIGGTALALPGQNTVNSGDVRNETLISEDLKDEQAVASSDVIDDTLENEDIGTGEVNSVEISNGQVFAQDLASNAVGHGDLATISAVADPSPHDFGNQDEGDNDYAYGTSTATCPAGSTVIGGGAGFAATPPGGGGGDELQAIHESGRDGANGWTATGASDVDDDDFQAFAYCLSTGT